MEIDVRGRIRNTTLSASNYLMPVFEAIMNSIQAIEEAKTEDGRIEVYLDRENGQLNLSPADAKTEPVKSFVITDNGIGFDDVNYKSFRTADSSHKIERGGKGVGRLAWLKAFSRADIESHYTAEDGSLRRRKFTFIETTEGIEGLDDGPSPLQERVTVVRLQGYRKPYIDQCPKSIESIAVHIIEHCIAYFALGSGPQITLKDSAGGDQIDLQSLFNNSIRISDETIEFKLMRQTYRLTHLKLRATSNAGQKVTLCAHQRAVISEPLQGRIVALPTSFREGPDGSFVYAGYLEGAYLDSRVNGDRTGFTIAAKQKDNRLPLEPSLEEVLVEACAHANKFLEPYTRPLSEANLLRIRRYVEESAPQYRPLLNHKKDELIKISSGQMATDEKLEMELHRLYTVYEGELKGRFSDLLTKATNDDLDFLHNEINEFIDEWNEDGKAKLADHVSYRKATLSLLDKIIKRNNDGKFSLERTIHNFVFPMRVTSDDVAADDVNLWIIDERLAYHSYLASDLPFAKMQEALVVDGEERPDLLIFKTASVFTEGENIPSSVVIVEFKRPMREDYSDLDNPVDQVLDYIRRVKDGQVKDRGGRTVRVPPGVPFFAYIIADLTPNLRVIADRNQMMPTHDEQGYFLFHRTYNCFIEIISFDKLVRDAKQRNAVLFEKLGIR